MKRREESGIKFTHSYKSMLLSMTELVRLDLDCWIRQLPSIDRDSDSGDFQQRSVQLLLQQVNHIFFSTSRLPFVVLLRLLSQMWLATWQLTVHFLISSCCFPVPVWSWWIAFQFHASLDDLKMPSYWPHYPIFKK